MFAVAYVIAVWQNYALFTYHPVPGTLAMDVEKSVDGPVRLDGDCRDCCVRRLSRRQRCAGTGGQKRGVRMDVGRATLRTAFFAYLLRGYFLR